VIIFTCSYAVAKAALEELQSPTENGVTIGLSSHHLNQFPTRTLDQFCHVPTPIQSFCLGDGELWWASLPYFMRRAELLIDSLPTKTERWGQVCLKRELYSQTKASVKMQEWWQPKWTIPGICTAVPIFSFLSLLAVWRDWMQGLEHARWVLYHLSHTPIPFCFWDTISLTLLRLASDCQSSCLCFTSAGITGMSLHAQLHVVFNYIVCLSNI
jgi:hypothetical protein